MFSFFRRMNRQDRLLQAYRDVFNLENDSARLVFENLIEVTGWTQDTYAPGLDPAAVAFREGRKVAVNHILTCLHYNEDHVGRMNVLLDAKERQIAMLNTYPGV